MFVWGPKRIQIKKLSTIKFHNFLRSITFVLEVSPSEIVYEIWSSFCRVPDLEHMAKLFFFVSFFFCSFCFLFLFFQIDYHALWIYLIKFSQLYVLNFSTHIIALFYGVIDQNSIYINSIIALDTLKLSNGSKKLPKFYTKQYICLLAIEKNFKVKLKFDRHFHSKPNRILLNSLILLRTYFHL